MQHGISLQKGKKTTKHRKTSYILIFVVEWLALILNFSRMVDYTSKMISSTTSYCNNEIQQRKNTNS